ncbi:hypothetical protein T12_1452 [Trichinella patagoniensis]|uniref:Uncharacterized protein n=1 Tax=Trichinella patagoniensis TaxID=990121 RepID=A0A0V0Z6K4_9BILA|nr:hypothetical protein T12_1452 [Trichinella patagoniensis]
MSIITVGTVAGKLLYSCEPRVFVIERSRIVSMKTFLVDFYWQQTRNEILLRYEKATRTKILLLHCKPKPNIFSAYTREPSLIVSRKPKISTIKMILSFHPSCGSKNLNFQVVSRWKAFYNETPVEFISEEEKAGRRIKQTINEMFSVTSGRIFVVSVHQTERDIRTRYRP